MQRNILSRWESPAATICGLVFTIIGTVFTILGIIVGFAVEPVFFLAFGVMGISFLIAGICCLIGAGRKKKQKKFLLERGNYIMAQVIETRPNYSVNVNGNYGYEVLCRYQDHYGTVHVFKSPLVWVDPTSLLTSDQVRVYVDGDDYDHYYVDLQSALPEIKMH